MPWTTCWRVGVVGAWVLGCLGAWVGGGKGGEERSGRARLRERLGARPRPRPRPRPLPLPLPRRGERAGLPCRDSNAKPGNHAGTSKRGCEVASAATTSDPCRRSRWEPDKLLAAIRRPISLPRLHADVMRGLGPRAMLWCKCLITGASCVQSSIPVMISRAKRMGGA
ncbi:hypothetical protein M433DRAFT_236064 [Acidomyces richmondensis BFW]|nr:MAG: hypothetical protein FE78DRAFT_436650 [Acidomyces sp. 'richmondensis']KYG40278.1 hypothetical protein M433DRAFT_236064 [Acidomyces richmondensis BFW]